MSRLTRRSFVKAVAAAPLAIPRSALGDDKKDAASGRLGLGFVGMGTMARGHLNHFLGQKDVQVLAVCDTDQMRREAAKKTVEAKYAEAAKSGAYKGCAAYLDFRELLARPDIDAVVIATPDHWHAIPCLEAIKAKKDIYCEKPLTLTILEAKRLVDAVRKCDRVFQTGSQQRSDREFRTACELVRSGRIGKLEAVYVNVGGPSRPCDLPEEKPDPGCDWDRWLGPAPVRPYNAVLSPRGVHQHFPDWRQYREYSGGMMTDWGAHHFDIAQWGLGMDESGPVEVVPPKDPKAGKGVKYLYANGVPVIHADESAPGKKVRGVTFVGSGGKIMVDRGYLASEPDGIVKETVAEKDRLYTSPGHQRDWLNCIKSRKRPICDVEVGARSVTVCHLGNIAYWTGQGFKWDPKAWQFVDAPAEVTKWLDRERRDPWQLPTV
ncbi:MAG: Gfo/Idh/MocA family oxidoreductase [Gemmataceae bacterium]|nr:Gfo/Idh/MocA family oxidoreductase [Gemmataceae bacterium]